MATDKKTAEKKNFPQLPGAVWHAVRERAVQTPSAKITEGFLSTVLKVDKTAAKQYLRQLQRMKLIDENGDLTPRGRDWRDDSKFGLVTEAILSETYPSELISVAPPPAPKREDVIRWFMNEAGLGSGAASNKAATYLMLASGNPKFQASSANRSPPQPGTKDGSRRSRKLPERSEAPRQDGSGDRAESKFSLPGNIQLNIQVHISADATVEQIDAIFASMARHLSDR